MKGGSNVNVKLKRDCTRFVETAYRLFEREPKKSRIFTDLILKYKHGSLKALELQVKLVEMLKDHSELIDQLNLLVPEEYAVPVHDPESNLQEVLASCMMELQGTPGALESLIELVTELKNKRNPTAEDFAKLDLLLKDKPEMRDVIKQHLVALQKNELNSQAGGNLANEQNQQIEVEEYSAARSRITRGKDNLKKNLLGRTEEKPSFVYVPGIAGSVSLPTALKNEYLLFEAMMEKLPKEQFEEFCKCIGLFLDMIISPVELFELTQGLFTDERYFGFFQEIISSRELARRKQTVLFKPSTEFDFSSNSFLISSR